MPDYKYQARTPAGKQQGGTVTAQNEADAIGELRRQNLLVVSLEEQAPKRSLNMNISLFQAKPGGAPRRPRIGLNELIIFTRQLSTMLSAGIPLLECLEILAEQQEDAGFKWVIEQIVEDIRSGSDFSAALRRHPKVFSQIFINMVKAGEAAGKLDDILVRLAEYQEATQALRQRIRAAMTYPVVSLVLILAIAILLLVFIIPKFEDIFRSMDVPGGLPLPTQIVLGISLWMEEKWYLWLGGIVGFVVGIVFYSRTNVGARQIDWIKLKVPIFGLLFRKVAISRFSRTFATLIQSGVPILGTLEIVASTAGNRIIEDAVIDASQSVRQGETLAGPLAKTGVFPPMVTRMISVGEKTGALEQLLEKISKFYDQQVATTVESLTSLIEPIMIGVMGIVVGGMVLAVFLPIFKLTSSLAR
jgi:type IV pilus assembly protein PilC